MVFWKNSKSPVAVPISATRFSTKFQNWLARIKVSRAWITIAALTVVGQMPRKVMLLVGSIVGKLFYVFNKKRRKYALANLEICFPHWPVEKRDHVARDHFRRYGQAVVDLGMLWFSSEHRLNRCISYKGIENWIKADSEGRPVIFLTPHVVGVDLTATLLARHVPLCTMMKDMKNSIMNERIKASRSRFGLKLYSRSKGVRPLIRNLNNKVSCYYIPDQDFGLKNSIFVPFFDVRASTLATLGRMARMTNALVLPVRAYLNTNTGQYNVTIGEPLADFPTNDKYVDARRMNAVFEEIIKEAPEQYMWTLNWFRTRPDNGPSLY